MKGNIAIFNTIDLEQSLSTLTTNVNTSYNNLIDKIDSNWNNIYPIDSTYITTTNTPPAFGGSWTLVEKLRTTDWNNFTYTNSTYYMRSTQDFYTRHQWRVVNNILYIQAGAGCSSTINHSNEDEVARIPIKNGMPTGTSNRIWTGAVGGSGAVGGFYVVQEANYISFKIKPHTSANNHAAPWYAAFINVPLNNTFTFDGNYTETVQYMWKRIA